MKALSEDKETSNRYLYIKRIRQRYKKFKKSKNQLSRHETGCLGLIMAGGHQI